MPITQKNTRWGGRGENGEKRCPTCKQVKLPTEYLPDARRSDGLAGRCRDCAYKARKQSESRPGQSEKRRERHLSKTYIITLAEYTEQLHRQNNACAICLRPHHGKRAMHVDHCHDTGEVRALLCSGCNTGLGGFNDNTESLQRAIDYLNTNRRN